MHLIKPIHLLFGIAGIVIFVLTGQYMAMFLHGLAGMPDGPRLLYRTSHLYLMWASLVNLLAGIYFVAAGSKGARIAQCVASFMLFAGPPLIIAGFFLESPNNNISRPFCGAANYLALAGTILHVVSSRRTGQSAL